MFRAILELIAVVLIITVLRSVIGIISKGFGNMVRPNAEPSPDTARLRMFPPAASLRKTQFAEPSSQRPPPFRSVWEAKFIIFVQQLAAINSMVR